MKVCLTFILLLSFNAYGLEGMLLKKEEKANIYKTSKMKTLGIDLSNSRLVKKCPNFSGTWKGVCTLSDGSQRNKIMSFKQKNCKELTLTEPSSSGDKETRFNPNGTVTETRDSYLDERVKGKGLYTVIRSSAWLEIPQLDNIFFMYRTSVLGVRMGTTATGEKMPFPVGWSGFSELSIEQGNVLLYRHLWIDEQERFECRFNKI